MKCQNNRADSHLTGQVECEMEGAGKGAWVNHGFCSTPPPIPRVVSTIYNTQPHFPGSVEGVYKLDPLVTFPEAPAFIEQNPGKKRKGCCTFIKGLWSTTLTENTSNNRELFVRTTLRELVVYVFFLVDICLCKYSA
ncbi:unnamed protein product [Tetraodon nigroviridis]|uniref:(spotted green pufferfish) hypothetical protein n=1 Tax=Tetraodon nigroviridis TaxID=99883 RepID=Q4S3Q8_TETNG|nr:unnamed protein product [Tetraodon nigroviridis]